MLRDLKRSGLTEYDARKADYIPLTAEETKELTKIRAASYLISYHDVKGNPTEYWRLRFTERPIGKFRGMNKGLPRYRQAPNTLPRFYFPARVDWEHINADVGEPIAITEGEKKAEKAFKAGIPCIAVGGVWAWRSKRKGIPAIKDFDAIKWKGRKVWLVFDNDLMTNPLVIGALNALGHKLTERGAKVVIKFLPKGPGKIGLDDYLLKHDKKAFFKLREERFDEAAKLWDLNERIAFIENVNGIWDLKTRIMYPNKQQLLLQFANNTYEQRKANGDGFVTKNTAEQWLAWDHRRQYDDLDYFPGDEPVVKNKINTWTGWGVDALKGTVKPVLDLIDYLLSDCPEHKAWFLQWLAYPIQYPGTKLFSSVLIWSSDQGVGKSLLAEIMRDIYGSNGAEINSENLRSTFNGWVENKQFIQGDEITGRNSRPFSDKLKAMITREKVEINKKYEKEYALRDCANYFFTSNHVDALFLEDRDRRYFVVEVSKSKKSDSFYARLRKWRDKPDTDIPNGKRRGASALRWYLENEVDLAGFNPHAAPPITDAKRDMQELSLSDVNRFTRLLRDDPDAVLKFKDHVNGDELFELHTLIPYSNRDVKIDKGVETSISKALRSAGFRKRRIRIGKIRPHLWAIRNREKWWRLSPSDWSEQYEKQTKQKFEAKVKKQQNEK